MALCASDVPRHFPVGGGAVTNRPAIFTKKKVGCRGSSGNDIVTILERRVDGIRREELREENGQTTYRTGSA